MKDMEILCRASAFLVKARNKSFHSKYHLLTVGHAVAPWRWPKHYPDEWLQQVNETHTIYTMEMRHADGLFLSQSILDSDVYHHPTRDFSVLHIEDEDSVFETLTAAGLPDAVHTLPDLSRGIPEFLLEGAKLLFHGHEVTNGTDNGADDRRSMPRTVQGTVIGRSKQQIFSKTTPTLVDGMCGGPVVFNGWTSDSKSSTSNSSEQQETEDPPSFTKVSSRRRRKGSSSVSSDSSDSSSESSDSSDNSDNSSSSSDSGNKHWGQVLI
jgi:hypothetical protein